MSWNDLDDIEEQNMAWEIRQADRGTPDSVAIVSGGLDSTVLVYDMLDKGFTPHMLSFNYGQRHKKELDFAKRTAARLGLRHDIVDLSGLTKLISNSALTSQTGLTVHGKNFEGGEFRQNIEVPDGHYAEDNMKATVVPNRNMIMLSIAAGVAVNNSYKVIATGVHAGDHFIYPDCRPAFIKAVAEAVEYGNEGFAAWDDNGKYSSMYTPFIHWSKADIAYRALELDVPLHETWSCYKGGDNHCGKCGTCVERLEAIDEAVTRWNDAHEATENVVEDFTVYEDTEFWKTAIENAIVNELSK